VAEHRAPAAVTARIQGDIKKWRAVVDKAGIKR
jgi:hypothetical protein